MCLSVINVKYSTPKKLDKPKIGYKVLRKNKGVGGGYKMLYYAKGKLYQVNKWYIDNSEKIISIGLEEETYKTGYHILKTRDDVRRFGPRFSDIQIVKVKYDMVTVEGTQVGCNCVVARRMMIIGGSSQKRI